MEHTCVDSFGTSLYSGYFDYLVFCAIALWILIILLWMGIMGWAYDCSNTPDPPKENKNPYSKKSSDFINKNKE